MRPRYTVALAALLAALCAYIYFVESLDVAAKNAPKMLLAVGADAIRGVTLTYGDRTIALAKGEGGWRLTAPLGAAADPVAVENLLRAVTTAEVTKSLDDASSDLAPFGLAPPFVTIALTAADATPPILKVGKATQVSGATYVQRGDEPAIVLTGAALRTAVDKQPKDLRDKSVVEFRDADITAITLRGPDGVVELSQQNGTWTITRPSAHAADNAAVRALLATLRTMQATDFANDAPAAADLAAYGLDAPRRELILRAGADREVRVRIGTETEQGVYVQAADQPTVFVVGKWAAGDLDKGVNELRDKTLLTFDPTAAGTIAVAHAAAERFTLSRGEGGWTLDGAGDALNASAVEGFVGALSRLTGTAVIGDVPPQAGAEFGLAPPALTVAVTGRDGAAIGTVRFGAHTPDPPATEYTAQRDGDPAVFALPDFQFKPLDRRRADFVATAGPTPAP